MQGEETIAVVMRFSTVPQTSRSIVFGIGSPVCTHVALIRRRFDTHTSRG